MPGMPPSSSDFADASPSRAAAQQERLSATTHPSAKQGKLFIKTYGCQMNAYDSEKIASLLAASDGLRLTETPDDADVIVVNTCSIREKAQEKVFSQLGRLRDLKSQGRDVIIGVGGCVASQEGEEILKRAPYVDLVFGPQTLHRLPDMLRARRAQRRPQIDISFPEIEKFDCLPHPKADGPCAFVSIMEGCSKYCSFCVVPYTRGTEISRPFKDVLVEVTHLARQGVREITLLGQNVNAYRGAMGSDDQHADLAVLIRTIAQIAGIDRIRFTTSHPLEFKPALVAAYRDVPSLANHLHLPVQSGSDRILAAMKRGYTCLEFKSILRKLRAVRPSISISSDFIVGFPGETEHEFQKTLDLIQEVGFDQSFSFIYSQRPGTPAADLQDDTPHAVKLARLQRLQAMINDQAAHISAAMVGTIQPVLVESCSRKNAHELTGRTENMRYVNFKGHQRLIGRILPIAITQAMTNTLRGVIADEAAESAALATNACQADG